MEIAPPCSLIESASTLPPSMEAAHVNVWKKINDECFITPAINRLNSLQDQGVFEQREKAFDARKELVYHFAPAMTPTPSTTSPLPAEAPPFIDSPPKAAVSQPHDPVVERIEDILGVVGIHQTILGEQVACTISLLEKTMAHVRRLHDHALLDITDAAQALRELRDDLKRKRSASTSPHQGKVASDNADKNLHACATTVEPTYTDLEEGHTVAAPGPPVSQEQNEYFCNSVSTKPVDNKQAEDERRSEGPYDNSRSPQQCESYRFTAKAQHQPRTQASAHGDGTPASLIKEASGTGRDERGSSSSEQKQPDVHDLIRKQQQPAQQRSDYAKELHDKHAAASRSKATCKKSSSSISPMATTRPVKGSKSRDTAFSPTSSLEKFSDGNTLLFTPVSPPSGGMKLYLPEPVTPKSVISSGNTPQSTLHTGQPLSKVQTAKPDEEIASVYPAPSVPSPTVKEPDVLATKGIKRRPDNPTDFERNCTRRRMS